MALISELLASRAGDRRSQHPSQASLKVQSPPKPQEETKKDGLDEDLISKELDSLLTPINIDVAGAGAKGGMAEDLISKELDSLINHINVRYLKHEHRTFRMYSHSHTDKIILIEMLQIGGVRKLERD